MSLKENHPLLQPVLPNENGSGGQLDAEGRAKADLVAAALYRNFVIMSVSFSVNHGCVVSCLAYSTTELGNLLGGYGSGVLYIFYALTAFFLAKPVVSMVGPKNGLLLGVSGYCVYVCGFLFAILVPVAAWPVFIFSCMIGGIAGGLLWTSQGMYFARNSKLYAEATGQTVETTNAALAGIFATAYLGIEMIAKVMATVISVSDPSKAPPIIFSLYTIMAVLSCIVVNMLDDLQQMGSWDLGFNSIIANSGAAASLVASDPRLMLMLPFQICFGFASSFVPYYVFGTIIKDSSHLGSAYVGLLSAVIVATGASMAIPSSWAAIKFGKAIVMTIGGFCLAYAGFALFVSSDDSLGTWKMIVPYLVIYGVGRGTWENTNKAVIADLFAKTPDLTASAFASISFFNGLAAAIAYFSFSSMTRIEMAGLVMISSLLAIGAYLLSAHIHTSNQAVAANRVSKYES